MALCLIGNVLCEITIFNYVQNIHEKSSKLYIQGTGFDMDQRDIILEISAPNQPSLKTVRDYLIHKNKDGLVLELMPNKTYV